MNDETNSLTLCSALYHLVQGTARLQCNEMKLALCIVPFYHIIILLVSIIAVHYVVRYHYHYHYHYM